MNVLLNVLPNLLAEGKASFYKTVVLVALLSAFTVALPVAAQDLPSIPDPVAVSVDRATTALLVLDMSNPICSTRPACPETVPTVAALLARARAANLTVVHSTTVIAVGWLPEVDPLPGEPTVASGADKFLNTNLHDLLLERGVTTVVVTGTFANGAVLYTSYEAAARGYTVVVASDAISSPTPFATYVATWQLMNGPGTANPDNAPLRPRAVTLSRSDLITFQ